MINCIIDQERMRLPTAYHCTVKFHHVTQILMNALMEPINACRTVTTLLVHTSALVKVVSLLTQMEELVMVSTVDPHPAAETNP